MFSRGKANGLVFEVFPNTPWSLLELAQMGLIAAFFSCASLRAGARRVTRSFSSAFRHSSGFSSRL
jgi:hypothetical protein